MRFIPASRNAGARETCPFLGEACPGDRSEPFNEKRFCLSHCFRQSLVDAAFDKAGRLDGSASDGNQIRSSGIVIAQTKT